MRSFILNRALERAGLLALVLVTLAACNAAAGAGASAEPPDGESTPPPATRPATLLLRVVDADTGEPVSGAGVEIYQLDAMGDPYAPLGKTGADGAIAVPVSTPSQFLRLRVLRDGYVGTEISWQHEGAEDRRDWPWRELPGEYALKLRRGVPIGGVVEDEAGRPVQDATVRVTPYFTSEDFNERDMEAQKLAEAPGQKQGASASWPRVSDDVWSSWTKTDAEGRWTWTRTHRADRVSVLAFTDTHIPAKSEATPELLERQAALLKVKPGVRLEGRVTDAEGRPVPQARLWVGSHELMSLREFEEKRPDRLGPGYAGTITWCLSDEEGNYLMPATGPASVTLVAVAPGHGPAMHQVLLPPEKVGGRVRHDLELPPPATLQARVINTDGEGIAGAHVALRGWRSQQDYVYQAARTDADGVFRMTDLPAESLSFDISADGYAYASSLELTPGQSTLETVVLKRPIQVRGAVTDATTGKPIPFFRVVAGYALWETQPPFFEYYNQIPTFENGLYDTTINGNPGTKRTVVRIEAAGYRPVVSEPLADGLNVFDAKLTPAPDVTGVVVADDGMPVVNATVIVALPGHQINIGSGKPFMENVPATRTDHEGRFTLPPQTDVWELLILHDDGYALEPMKHSAPAGAGEQAGEPHRFALKPWARIEGRIDLKTADGNPVKGFSAHIAPFRPPLEQAARILWSSGGSVEVEQGRYVIDKLPDFDGRPAILSISTGATFGETRTSSVTLRPGEVELLDLLSAPPGSRPVRGHIFPESEKADISEGVQGRIAFYAGDLPAPLEAPADPDEAVAMAQPIFAANLFPDGTFRLEGVPPGRYSVQATLWTAKDTAFGGTGFVDVPEGEGEVDVGGVPIALMPTLPAQLRLPEILGNRYQDGEPIRREALAGKWTLLLLYAACDSTTAARLEEIAALTGRVAPLSESGRLSMLAIACDRVSCGITGVPVRPELLGPMADGPWQQGYLDPAQGSVLGRMGARTMPWFILLDPQGNARWFGSDIAQAGDVTLEHMEE